jgi:N-acetylgalactosamine-N,N'-diacetylbacillosaminyl-diphospho-undecaprenol 4-alpha-N-acetylgalactosaminyltransferase
MKSICKDRGMHKKLSIFLYSLGSGGAERVASVLLDELKESFDITLILMNDTIFYEVPKEIDVVFLEKSRPFENGLLKFLKLPLLSWKYKKILKKYNIDISLSLMNRPNYINIMTKFFAYQGRVIISERGTPSKYYKDNLQGKISKSLIRFLYPKADKIVVNSMGNYMDLVENFLVRERLLKLIYNLYDIQKIDFQKGDSCDILKNDNSFKFITVGRVDEGKNHRLLIKSLKNLDIDDAKLYIIGEGELKNELEQYVVSENMENKVIFLGHRKNPYKYIYNSDCFVFSSNYEGFPNVLLEALLCELPVISTDCKSGPREILAPNTPITQETSNIELAEYGILTKVDSIKDMQKAMKLIYKDKNLRDTYKNKAKIRANEFDKKKIIKRWIEVLDG